MSQTAEPTETEEEKDARLGPCAVCEGKFSEHKNRIHAFTQTVGDLVSKAQDEKRRAKPQPVVVRTQSVHLGKLIERLVDKEVFDSDDVLYITGLKER
jgi:hypothetical protein